MFIRNNQVDIIASNDINIDASSINIAYETELRFYEGNDYIGFKAPSTVDSQATYT